MKLSEVHVELDNMDDFSLTKKKATICWITSSSSSVLQLFLPLHALPASQSHPTPHSLYPWLTPPSVTIHHSPSSSLLLSSPVVSVGRVASEHSMVSGRRRVDLPPAPAHPRSASSHPRLACSTSETHTAGKEINKNHDAVSGCQRVEVTMTTSSKDPPPSGVCFKDAALCWSSETTPCSPDTEGSAGRMLPLIKIR